METKEYQMPKHYKDSKFCNWDGVYYYHGQPCEVIQQAKPGIVVDHYGDRAGSFDIHDNGYIFGKTICGIVHLKIIP